MSAGSYSRNDIVRAHRLRKALDRRALTGEERAWLDKYESDKASRGRPRTATAPPIEMAERPAPADAPAEPAPGFAAAATWVPVLPPEEGAKEPAPVIDNAAADSAAIEAAAAKLGGLLAVLTSAGLASARELAAAGKLPTGNALVATLDAKTEKQLLAHVAGCGARVAKKYGLGTAWEYEDEATVVAAAGASVFCILQARALAAPAPPAVAPTNDEAPAQKETNEPRPSEVFNAWVKRGR